MDEFINTLVWSQCSYLQTHCDLGWNSKAISAHSKYLTHYRWREKKQKERNRKNKCDSSRLRLMPIPLKVLTKLCHLLAISPILLLYVKIILPLPGTLDPTQTIKLSKHIDVTRNAIKQLGCKDHFLLHLYSCRLKAVFSIELLYSCFPLIALAIFNK